VCHVICSNASNPVTSWSTSTTAVPLCGLVRRAAGGEGSESATFLERRFAGTDRIWVPVEQIDRVTRYAGGDDPQSLSLGGGEWQRTKSRVRKAVANLARTSWSCTPPGRGHGAASSATTRRGRPRWRRPFPTRRRPTKLRAALEVKSDLERETPMDRLVVGDW